MRESAAAPRSQRAQARARAQWARALLPARAWARRARARRRARRRRGARLSTLQSHASVRGTEAPGPGRKRNGMINNLLAMLPNVGGVEARRRARTSSTLLWRDDGDVGRRRQLRSSSKRNGCVCVERQQVLPHAQRSRQECGSPAYSCTIKFIHIRWTPRFSATSAGGWGVAGALTGTCRARPFRSGPRRGRRTCLRAGARQCACRRRRRRRGGRRAPPCPPESRRAASRIPGRA